MQALSFHRRFEEKLAIRTGCTVSLLDFPLPPQAQCIETVCAVMRMYKAISLLYRQHRVILMGDSAGGGLAISLLQKLLQIPANNPAGKIKDIRAPDCTILYSPWLDICLTHREIEPHYAKKEAILSLPALRQAGACAMPMVWHPMTRAARPYVARWKVWAEYRYSSARMSCFILMPCGFMNRDNRPKAPR